MTALDYAQIADIYDGYVQVDFDIPFFLEQASLIKSPILELMCGTGRVSIPLIEAGAHLTCVDQSPEMLAILHAKLASRGLTAELIQADVCDLDLGRQFELAIIPFHSFSEIQSHADQQQALNNITGHLLSGGRLVVTLGNPSIRLKRADGLLRLWTEQVNPQTKTSILLWGREAFDPTSGLVKGHQLYEIYNAQGVLHEQRMVRLSFRLVEKDEFEAMAMDAGLEVVSLFGDYVYSTFQSDTSPFMIWILKKQS